MLARPSPESDDRPQRPGGGVAAAGRNAATPVPVNVEPQRFEAQTPYQTAILLFICLMLWIYMLYFARVLILPILIAILLKLVLAPAVQSLTRVRVPEAVGAALVLLLATAVVAYGAYMLSAPASEWVTRIPERLYILRMHLSHVQEPFEYIQQAARAISQLSTLGDPGAAQPAAPTAAPAASIDQITIGTVVLSETASITVSLGSIIVLLYFLLASGDMFLRKLVTVLPTFSDKKQAVEIAHRVQSDISSYLLTITLINTALGAIVAGALYLYGMPSPVLWGAMVGLFNFVPFLGPAVCIGIVALASFMSFPLWQTAIIPPLIVAGVCFLEGEFITPMVLARRLVLNPVAVFVALLFCGWLWGIVGVLVSVPLLAVFKIFCDHVRPLTPIGEFLGR
jgi:predicted PurR-regulated permease PerM